jgi:hypothetical protein
VILLAVVRFALRSLEAARKAAFTLAVMLNYLTKLYQLGALPVVRPGPTQKVAIGSASTLSTAVGAQVVRLVATADCHIAFGASPTADASSLLLTANLPEYFACESTEAVAVIADSGEGALYITPAL